VAAECVVVKEKNITSETETATVKQKKRKCVCVCNAVNMQLLNEIKEKCEGERGVDVIVFEFCLCSCNLLFAC